MRSQERRGGERERSKDKKPRNAGPNRFLTLDEMSQDRPIEHKYSIIKISLFHSVCVSVYV